MNAFINVPLAVLLVAGISLALPIQANPPAKEDVFLDQPLPGDLKWEPISIPPPDGKGPNVEEPFLKINSYQEGLALMGKITGKKIILPEGLTLDNWPKGPSDGGRFISFGGGTKTQKVRDVFKMLCICLGVLWHYDAQQDVLFLNLKWQRDDPRSGKELAKILAEAKPVRWDQLQYASEKNSMGGHDKALDNWRSAFDALLSKPENLSSAGALRLYHDNHGHGPGFGPFPVINLFAGKVRADNNQHEILVLNEQESMSNKDDPGDIAYYLFDENGKFIKGGVYAMAEGYEGAITKAKADDDQRITIDVGWGSFDTEPDHVHFAMVNGDFILQGSTDSNGKERNAQETQAKFPYPLNGGGLGILKYSVSSKAGG